MKRKIYSVVFSDDTRFGDSGVSIHYLFSQCQ